MQNRQDIADVTDTYRNMLSRFECDFELASDPKDKYTLNELQSAIDKGNFKLKKDIELFQRLELGIRHGTIKIMEVQVGRKLS